jgi:hypothetical protein
VHGGKAAELLTGARLAFAEREHQWLPQQPPGLIESLLVAVLIVHSASSWPVLHSRHHARLPGTLVTSGDPARRRPPPVPAGNRLRLTSLLNLIVSGAQECRFSGEECRPAGSR